MLSKLNRESVTGGDHSEILKGLLGEVPLALTFPSLFDMPSDKDVWVSSYIQDNNWALSFRHPLCLARLQMLAVLTGVLQWHTFRDTPDQVI